MCALPISAIRLGFVIGIAVELIEQIDQALNARRNPIAGQRDRRGHGDHQHHAAAFASKGTTLVSGKSSSAPPSGSPNTESHRAHQRPSPVSGNIETGKYLP